MHERVKFQQYKVQKPSVIELKIECLVCKHIVNQLKVRDELNQSLKLFYFKF